MHVYLCSLTVCVSFLGRRKKVKQQKESGNQPELFLLDWGFDSSRPDGKT